MPNTFIKPTVIAATALGLLEREIMLPGLVWQNAVGNFSGAYGDTVSLRIPSRTTARTNALRATGSGRQITLDTLTETKIDVTLDKHVYSAIAITDEELTLDIVSFAEQILRPQVRAVAEKLENDIAATMQAVSYKTTVALNSSTPYNSIVDARKALNDENVDKAGRVLVVGSAIEALLLKDPQFVYVDRSGSDSALRDAEIGRIAGMPTYTSNSIDPYLAYAFHKSAYITCYRAPRVPEGATFGQSTTYANLALRWIRDYDPINVQDRSVVSVFTGNKAVNDGASDKMVRAVKITLAPYGS